jgi:hypothetical protein
VGLLEQLARLYPTLGAADADTRLSAMDAWGDREVGQLHQLTQQFFELQQAHDLEKQFVAPFVRTPASSRCGLRTCSSDPIRRMPQVASQFRSVVSVLVRFVGRTFSTNSRPASGRPPAALGRRRGHAAGARSRSGTLTPGRYNGRGQ